MGRYIERTENTARFIKVHLYSALDSNSDDKKQYMYKSILTMMGLDKIYEIPEGGIQDEQVFYSYLAVDTLNISSMRYSLTCARENARGARDSISTDVWNTINVFYHAVNKFEKKKFTNNDLNAFCDLVLQQCAILYSQIETSLLHNEIVHFIKLGIFLERASQTVRIIYAKTETIRELSQDKANESNITHEYMTMLKCAEAYDMSKKYYRSLPTGEQAIDFLMFNTIFPKSILYNLNGIIRNLKKLSDTNKFGKDTLEYKVNKWIVLYGYTSLAEIDNLEQFLDEILDQIYFIASELEQKYMK